MTANQKNTTWQEVMPQEYISQIISAEQPTTEQTIAHLFDEQIAMPIHISGEVPGYHSHYLNSKCLHTASRLNRNTSHLFLNNGFEHHHSPIYNHVIDYYIYTLKHILI